MAVASGPTLLSSALGMTLHGETGVIVAALAFTAGCLLAPTATNLVARRPLKPVIWWPALGMGMVVGWTIAPWHIAGLAVAQVLSGLSMSAFEGMMDAGAAASSDRNVTSALARTAATRALGSAVAVGLAPMLITTTSLGTLSAGLGAALAISMMGGIVLGSGGGRVKCQTLRSPGRAVPESVV
jgi:hypothetical protein